MSMTDPIADMLTRIRNANQAMHSQVEIPASKMKTEIARLLKEQGYIAGFEVKSAEHGDVIVIDSEVRQEPRTRHLGHQARLEAGTPHLRPQGDAAAGCWAAWEPLSSRPPAAW